MIGRNGSAGETFTAADAQTVLKYARANREIVLLSMWSMRRDNGSCAGTVSPACCGIPQAPREFVHILRAF